MWGNGMGLIMFVAVSPLALIGGLILKLGDPLTMSCVGFALLVIDLIVRVRSRSSSGWLLARKFGGVLFFLPVWMLGIVVIVINIVNAFVK